MSSASFFKRNEKVIMVVLLVLIAPLFAFTGVFYSALSNTDQTRLYLYDEPVTNTAFQRHQRQIRDFHMFQAQRQRGALTDPVSGSGRRMFRPQEYFYVAEGGTPIFEANSVHPDEVLQRMVLLEEARRMGLTISDEELKEATKAAGRDLIAHYKYWKDIKQRAKQGDPVQYQPNPSSPEFKLVLDGTVFKNAELRELLNDEDFTNRIKPQGFQELLRLQLTLDKLKGLVSGSVQVSESEVYEQFRDTQALRSLALVRVPVGTFEEKARAEEPTEEQLKAVYETYQSEFDLPNRLSLETARLKIDELPVTDEEVQAQYDKDKGLLYIKESTEKPEEGEPAPAPEYQPLSEVRDDVARDVRNEKNRTIIREAFAKAEELQKAATEGEDATPFDLVSAFGENASFVEIATTDVFGQREIYSLPKTLQNQPVLTSLFSPARYEALQSGELGRGPIFLITGAYIYRIAEKAPAEVQPFEKVERKLLVEKLLVERTYELAEEYVTEWREKIVSDEAVTLESFAVEENLTMITTEALKRTESSKVSADGKTLGNAAAVLNAVFRLAEPGDLTDPVPGRDRKEIALAEFVGKEDPNSADFEAVKTGLEQRLTGQKQRETWQEFVNLATESAQPKYPKRADEDE